MPIMNFSIDTDEDLDEQFAEITKLLNYLLNGRIDSVNVFEVGGWRVGRTQMASKDGDVGFSTEDTGADDIRIWAGDAKDGSPNFTVTKAGILTAVAAIIMSAAGYPRITLNQNSNLLQAFSDANNHVDFSPSAGTTPGIVWTAAGSTAAYMQASTFGVLLAAFGSSITLQSGSDLNLSIPGNLSVNNQNGYSGPVYYVKNVLPDGSGGYYPDYGTMTFTKGILTSVT